MPGNSVAPASLRPAAAQPERIRAEIKLYIQVTTDANDAAVEILMTGTHAS